MRTEVLNRQHSLHKFGRKNSVSLPSSSWPYIRRVPSLTNLVEEDQRLPTTSWHQDTVFGDKTMSYWQPHNALHAFARVTYSITSHQVVRVRHVIVYDRVEACRVSSQHFEIFNIWEFAVLRHFRTAAQLYRFRTHWLHFDGIVIET